MVSVPVSSAVDRWFVAQSDQVKDNKNNKELTPMRNLSAIKYGEYITVDEMMMISVLY
jgi:hypothetical protein